MENRRQLSEEIDEYIEHSEKSEHNNLNSQEDSQIRIFQQEHEEKNEQEQQKDEEEQQELYEKTLVNQASVEKRSRRSSVASLKNEKRPNSARSSPLVSRSMNFESKPNNKKSHSSLSNLSVKDPYLRSINDLKYLGDQFVVGKINPNQKSVFEIKFEKRYQNTLKKLSQSTNRLSPAEIISTYKRTKDKKVILDPRFTLTNELKFTGDQFKVGKIDPKLQSTFEKRFQERFKSQLKSLLPSKNKSGYNLNFNDLKEIQEALSIPKYRISNK